MSRYTGWSACTPCNCRQHEQNITEHKIVQKDTAQHRTVKTKSETISIKQNGANRVETNHQLQFSVRSVRAMVKRLTSHTRIEHDSAEHNMTEQIQQN